MAGRLTGFIRRVLLINPGEGCAVLLSGAYCFLLFCSYYTLKPLRDAVAVGGSLEHLPWFMAGTMGAMLAFHPIYTLLSLRMSPRAFVPAINHFFVLGMVAFWALFRFSASGVWLVAAFFVWTSVFNLFAVSVFWSCMSDEFSPRQGARLFGLISVGGTVGSVIGSGIASWLAGVLDPVNLLLVAACIMETAIICSVILLARRDRIRAANSTDANGGSNTVPIGGPAGELALVSVADRAGPFHVLSRIARSRYLQQICLYVMLFTITQTFVYFEQARIVKDSINPDARAGVFARIDLFANCATVLLQLFLSGRIVTRLGVGGTLAVTPIVTIAGFVALHLSPTLATITVFQVARRSMHFALDRPARELLFTPLEQADRFASKSFIDTFIYRGGDLAAAGAYGLIPSLGAIMPMVAIPTAAVWLGVGLLLGRARKRLGSS